MYGEEIKQARKAQGYTQQAVAQGTGIPQNTISWIEKNKGLANIYQCVLLADFYGITLDELVGRDSKKAVHISDSFNNNSGNINFKA